MTDFLDDLAAFFNADPHQSPNVQETELRTKIFQDICDERHRQDVLQEQGKFPCTSADPTYSEDAKFRILTEETGEVGRELNEQEIHYWRQRVSGVRGDATLVPYDRTRLRAELIQVAAVAVAWVEAIDKGPSNAQG